MKESSWTKAELIAAIAVLKQKIKKLEKSESKRKQAESQREAALEAMKISEQKYRGLTENINLGIYRNTVGPEGKFIEANPAIIMMFGYESKEEFLAMNVSDLYQDPKDRSKFNKKMLKTGVVNDEELWLKKKDGSFFIGSVSAVAVKNKRGQVTYYDGIIDNISERKQAEKEKEQIISLQRAAIESTADGILVIDYSGKITDFNQQFAQMWRIPDSILASRDDDQALRFVLDQLLEPQGFLAKVNELYAAPNQESFDILQFRDGRCFERYSRPQLISGRPVGRVWSFRDVSERKQAAAEMASLALFPAENPNPVLRVNQEGKLLYINQAGVMLLSDWHLNVDEFVPQFLRQAVVEAMSGQSEELEAIIQGGRVISFFIAWVAPMDYANLYGRDITERKRAEAQIETALGTLRESEERFRSLYENSTVGLYRTTPDGRIRLANPVLVRLLGYLSFDDIVNRNLEKTGFGPSYPRRQFVETIEKYGEVKGLESAWTRNDGTIFYCRESARAIRDGQGKTLYYDGTIEDITERKQAESKLREEQKLISTILTTVGDPIFVKDNDHRFVLANRAFYDLLGLEEKDVIGRTLGETLPADEMLHFLAIDRQVLDTGIPNLCEEVLTSKNGVQRAIITRKTRFLDDSGKKFMVGAIHDISELKQAEEEKRILQERLQWAEKMEAIGTLAGGIAHDFNNLLMGIQGYASMTLTNLDPNNPNYERLQRIEQQVQSGAELTSQLLGFARGGRYEVKPTNMNDIIEQTSSMFGRTKKEISIQRKHEKNLWSVEVDRGQMEQVFLNLYMNAWQAMPGGGEIHLETENVLLKDEKLLPCSVTPGKYVKITVTDSGTGMDEKTRERIFDPFFTTKEMGRGIGLGLASVYGIVKGHRGMINVYSEPGHGTTFTIYLPASEKEVFKEMTATEEILMGAETILLVEDEKLVLTVSKEMLESLGYRVYAAASGQEAVTVYLKKRNKIDLVILDMIMPGLSGSETFARLREINPDVKVLLSSGYSLNGEAQHIMDRGCNGFLQKPFHIKQLSSKVRKILGGNNDSH